MTIALRASTAELRSLTLRCNSRLLVRIVAVAGLFWMVMTFSLTFSDYGKRFGSAAYPGNPAGLVNDLRCGLPLVFVFGLPCRRSPTGLFNQT